MKLDHNWKRLNSPFSNYFVSKNGDVAGTGSRNSNKILKPAITYRGYFRVTLHGENSTKKNMSVHRLVAECWLDGFIGQQINHKNGVKTDNRIENLEISSPSHNQKHSAQTLGKRNYKVLDENKIKKIMKMWATGTLLRVIAKKLKTNETLVYSHIVRRFKTIDSEYCAQYREDILDGYIARPNSRYYQKAIALRGGGE